MPTIRADRQLAATLGQEATGLLRALLKLDTQSPPGNERLAADYIAAVLTAEGIPSDIVEAAPAAPPSSLASAPPIPPAGRSC